MDAVEVVVGTWSSAEGCKYGDAGGKRAQRKARRHEGTEARRGDTGGQAASGTGESRGPSPYSHGADNARVVLTGAAPEACVATSDPHDRAHGQYEAGTSMLAPAADVYDRTVVIGARPRRYPPCYMVGGEARGHEGTEARRGRLVSFETSFEMVGALEDELRHALGVTLFARVDTATELAMADARLRHFTLRQVLERGRGRWATSVGWNGVEADRQRAEEAAEAAADAWLAAHA